MWNDIDLYHAVRDFTSDPVSFPGEEMRKFIGELVCTICSRDISRIVKDSLITDGKQPTV